jgi:hypothetical protein
LTDERRARLVALQHEAHFEGGWGVGVEAELAMPAVGVLGLDAPEERVDLGRGLRPDRRHVVALVDVGQGRVAHEGGAAGVEHRVAERLARPVDVDGAADESLHGPGVSHGRRVLSRPDRPAGRWRFRVVPTR